MLFGGVIHISPLQSFGSQFSVESAVGIEGKTHLSGFDTHFAQLLIEFGFGSGSSNGSAGFHQQVV